MVFRRFVPCVAVFLLVFRSVSVCSISVRSVFGELFVVSVLVVSGSVLCFFVCSSVRHRGFVLCFVLLLVVSVLFWSLAVLFCVLFVCYCVFVLDNGWL